jgi:hypothetical protein
LWRKIKRKKKVVVSGVCGVRREKVSVVSVAVDCEVIVKDIIIKTEVILLFEGLI